MTKKKRVERQKLCRSSGSQIQAFVVCLALMVRRVALLVSGGVHFVAQFEKLEPLWLPALPMQSSLSDFPSRRAS